MNLKGGNYAPESAAMDQTSATIVSGTDGDSTSELPLKCTSDMNHATEEKTFDLDIQRLILETLC